MDETLQKNIADQWEILPDDIKAVLLSPELETKLDVVAEKYQLAPEQAVSLKTEVQLVLLGLEHIIDFAKNLTEELKIQKEQARAISQEVGSQIFLGVKESLKTLGEIIDILDSAVEDYKKEMAEQKETQTPTEQITPETILPPNPPDITLIPEHTELGTIIDEKLSKIVRTPTEKVVISERPANTYKGNDPYREPTE